jgi:hypothetical protein
LDELQKPARNRRVAAVVAEDLLARRGRGVVTTARLYNALPADVRRIG